MKTAIIFVCLFIILVLAACSTESGTVEVTTVGATATLVPPATTPIPPTATIGPTPCDEVDGTCLYLHFAGEGCTYVGPNDFESGPVTLIFLNESEETAAVNMVRLDEDRTVQDYIEDVGEEPSRGHAPDFVTHIDGVWKSLGIRTGESHTWEGVLEPGDHIMVCGECGGACGGMKPLALWTGGVLTVEE